MSSVSVLIDLRVPGYTIADLTVTCQKWQDRSVVSSAGCTLTAIGSSGRYWLTHPSVTELLGFEAYVTAWPENYVLGSFDPFVRANVAAPAGGTGVIIDLHAPGYAIGDLTVALQKRSDKSAVSTAGMTLVEIGSTGRYWLIHPAITEVTGYEVYVTAWPENYAFGLLDQSAWPFRWVMGGTSKRDLILAALAARLATILTANGYRTNLGQNVQEWDLTPLDPDQSALLVEYRDEAGTTSYQAVGEHLHTLPVSLRVRCQNNTAGSALSTVRDAVADIYQAIYLDVTFGGLAQDTNQQGSMRENKGEAGDTAAGAEVTYLIEYTTAPGSP